MILYEKIMLNESNLAAKYKGTSDEFVAFLKNISKKDIDTKFKSLNDIKKGICGLIADNNLYTNADFKKYIASSKSAVKAETVDCLKYVPEDCKNRQLLDGCILATYGENNDFYFYSEKSGHILYFEYETNVIEDHGTIEDIVKKEYSTIMEWKNMYGNTNESLIAVAAIGFTAFMAGTMYFMHKTISKIHKRKAQEVMDYINAVKEKGFKTDVNFKNPNSPKLYEYIDRGVFTDQELREFIKKNKKYYDKISNAVIFELNASGNGDASKLLNGAVYIGNAYNTDLWYGPNGKVYEVCIENVDKINISIPDVGSVNMTDTKLLLDDVAESYQQLILGSTLNIHSSLLTLGCL